MRIAYLNGEFLPLEQARISPLDRGFLFGDGIYEVIPSYDGQFVGFAPHIARLNQGLHAIGIELNFSDEQWREICAQLCEQNGQGNLGIYIQVSRGADTSRGHAFPQGIRPTVFVFTFDIAAAPIADKQKVKGFKVISQQDLRWQRCHIKSTSLLGNVLHYQTGKDAQVDETILFNDKQELTEASSCNLFIVKDGVVITPPLDHQKLPGISRMLLLHALSYDASIKVEERAVTLQEAREADEIWLTSSSKEVAPVVELDGQPVGTGSVGDMWLKAQTLFSQHKFEL